MANTTALVNTLPNAKNVVMLVQVLLTGSYANPEVIDLTQLSDAAGEVPEGFFELVTLGGIFGENLNGYWAEFIPGTALNNCQLVIYSAAGAKIGAVTYASLGIVSPENQVILQIPRRNM